MDHAGLFLALVVLAPILAWIGWDRENQPNKRTLPKAKSVATPKPSPIQTSPSGRELELQS